MIIFANDYPKQMTEKNQSSNQAVLPFFFILGRPRSGTTLLQSLFDAHPNVLIPGECPVILRIYLRFGQSDFLDNKLVSQMMDFIKQLPKIDYWPIDFEKLNQDLFALKGEFNFQKIIECIWRNNKSAFPKEEIKILGDKNPPYSKYPSLLLKLFPQAKFIYIVRDYRDHYLSMKKTGLLNGAETLIIHLWKRSGVSLNNLSKKYPEHFFTLKYEDLANNPDQHLKELCHFLNIPFQKEMLLFHQNKEKSLKQYGEKNLENYHQQLFKPISTNNIGQWKDSLSEKEIMIADYLAGNQAQKSGYERKHGKIPIRLKLWLLPRISLIKTYLYLMVIINILPAVMKKRIHHSLPELHHFYLKFFRQ